MSIGCKLFRHFIERLFKRFTPCPISIGILDKSLSFITDQKYPMLFIISDDAQGSDNTSDLQYSYTLSKSLSISILGVDS